MKHFKLMQSLCCTFLFFLSRTCLYKAVSQDPWPSKQVSRENIHLFWSFLAAPIAVEDVVMIGRGELVHCVSDNISNANHVPHIAEASAPGIFLCTKLVIHLHLRKPLFSGKIQAQSYSHRSSDKQPCHTFRKLFKSFDFPLPSILVIRVKLTSQ